MLRGARFAAGIVPAPARHRWLEWRDARTGTVDLAGWARPGAHCARLRAVGRGAGRTLREALSDRRRAGGVFPPVFIRELGRFHDQVTPHPFAALAPTLDASSASHRRVFRRSIRRRLRRLRSRRFTAPSSARPSR
jgi:hypothetical protein